jgi:peptidoglycan hydrolase-like protein with peptidoglycan-binding domain
MRWRAFFSVGAIVVSLGSPGGPGGACGPAHAASALPAGATSQPRFIREAQRALEELGYRPGPIDGVVGPRTQGALVRYQRSERIPVTGYLDAETMVRLDIHERVSRPASRLASELSRTFEADPGRAAVATH